MRQGYRHYTEKKSETGAFSLRRAAFRRSTPVRRVGCCEDRAGVFHFVVGGLCLEEAIFLDFVGWEFNIIVALTLNWLCTINTIISCFISVSTNLKINHLLKPRTWKWKMRYDTDLFLHFASVYLRAKVSCRINLSTLVIDWVTAGVAEKCLCAAWNHWD